MLKSYFETMIGKKINQSIATGDTFFTNVYKRAYQIEILAVDKDRVYVDVNSYDIVPSGYKAGGTDQHLGEANVSIGKKSKSEIMYEILQRVDGPFIHQYKIKAV